MLEQKSTLKNLPLGGEVLPYHEPQGVELVDYFLQNFECILLDMKLAALNAILAKAELEGRFIEAYLVKSVYVEGVINILALAAGFHAKGYDGDEKSVAEAIQTDANEKKVFLDLNDSFLKDKIRAVRDNKSAPKQILNIKQVDQLFTWVDQRNDIFHNFVNKMLTEGYIEENCKKAYEYLCSLTAQDWFKAMEKTLITFEGIKKS